MSETRAPTTAKFHNSGVNNVAMDERTGRSNQVLLWIIGLSTLLLIVSALISSNREPNALPSGSPESVVQSYLTAIIEGRNDTATEYFSSTSQCDATDIDRAYVSDTLRVNLVRSNISGDSAYVRIDANSGSGGLFDDGYVESHTYRLIKESTGWKIAGIPWPLWDCGEVGK